MTIGIKDPSLFAKGRTADIYTIDCGLVKKQLRDTETTHRVNKILRDYCPLNIKYAPLIYHETRALMLLQKYNIAPKVIDIQKDHFIMTYTGKQVRKHTQFKNLKKRIDHILKALTETDITHNDLRRDFRNYTVLDGVLYLIDFQVADIGNARPSHRIRIPDIRKGKKHYNDNRSDLEWFFSCFSSSN